MVAIATWRDCLNVLYCIDATKFIATWHICGGASSGIKAIPKNASISKPIKNVSHRILSVEFVYFGISSDITAPAKYADMGIK